MYPDIKNNFDIHFFLFFFLKNVPRHKKTTSIFIFFFGPITSIFISVGIRVELGQSAYVCVSQSVKWVEPFKFIFKLNYILTRRWWCRICEEPTQRSVQGWSGA